VTISIKALLDEFDGEVGAAIASYYAWKTLRDRIATDREILDALNHNPRSWTLFMHTLQLTFFVTLGRIFDRTKGTFTVHRFLAVCKSNVAEFSAAAFEARRIAENHGRRPDYMDGWMRTYYAARPADFEALEAAAVPYANRFRVIYKPIRDKLMAHRDTQSIGAAGMLFAATEIGEVEAMLTFLNSVWGVVRELYLNGRKTSLSDHRIKRAAATEADIDSLLRRIAAAP
jgi:hypothetical protein